MTKTLAMLYDLAVMQLSIYSGNFFIMRKRETTTIAVLSIRQTHHWFSLILLMIVLRNNTLRELELYL